MTFAHPAGPQGAAPPAAVLDDDAIVARVLAGEAALFELLMRRHNPRAFRAACAVLRDTSEAEDVMQEAYVRAFEHLSQYQGHGRFSAWLTRIVVHEALARRRTRSHFDSLDAAPENRPWRHGTTRAPSLARATASSAPCSRRPSPSSPTTFAPCSCSAPSKA